MQNTEMKIEERMQNMKNSYLKVGDMIEQLPDAIPAEVKALLKDKILGDKELKKLMCGVDSHRPPRIFMIGRTGVGKSSLINALCGAYVANVSDISSCTDTAYSHIYKDNERVLLEILDTRGIAESTPTDEKTTAEDMLLDQISEFSPDAAIFMLSCASRDYINEDAAFLKKVAKRYADENVGQELPIIVVLNKCDMVPPKSADLTSEKKLKNIERIIQNCKTIIGSQKLKVQTIIPITSYMEWKTETGEDEDVLTAEEINTLPKSDIHKLQISFDGRYNIDKLFTILEESIEDLEAKMGLRMSLRLKEVVKKFANHLIKIFSAISATVALTPVPVSDIYILTIIECILVALIAALSGREVSLDTAKKFVLSLGGVVGAGFGFRLAAQQSSKLINLIFPGAGSAISSVVAVSGTTLIGKAAISYFIDGKDLAEIKKLLNESKDG